MKPFKHQKEIVDRSWQEKGFAFFCDTGVGKTKMALDTAEKLQSFGLIDAVLIVAPAGTYRNWTANEIPKHCDSGLRPDVAYWVSSFPAKKRDELKEWAATPIIGWKILAINVEAFSHPKSEAVKLAETFLTTHKVLMVIDESTQIKVPTSAKTKTILRLGRLAKYRRVLSGMPVTESPENLYTQCLFLGTKKFPYNSFYAFRNRFCTIERKQLRIGGSLRSFDIVTGAQREKELHNLITSFGSVIHKSECLDLPPKLYERRTVELSPEQKQAYQDMKKNARVVFEDKEVSVVNVLGVLEKLHQITCGFIKLEDGKHVAHLDNNRIRALMEQLDESQGKVVIWCNYVQAILAVEAALTETYGPQAVKTFYGATEAEMRPEIMARFQDPKAPLRFLVANPSTGKYSWTLTTAHTAIYYSNSYKLEDRYQSEDRLHRIGQENKVTYIDLVTPGTVDEDILNALREKRNIAAEIMGPQWKEALSL